MDQSGFARWHDEAVNAPLLPAWGDKHDVRFRPGTYELIGPKINGNPERESRHCLVRHERAQRLEFVPRDYDGLGFWLRTHDYEGIVWHHPDGRMAKLKARDFPREQENQQ